MTTQEVLDLIELFKVQTAQIKKEWPFTDQVHWTIPDLSPDIMSELARYLKVNWFKLGNGIALIVYDLISGCHVTLISVPCEVQEELKYILK